MAGLLSLVGTIFGSEHTFLSKEGDYVYLIPLKKDGTIDFENGRAFQYWPAELADNVSPNYSNKTIPGGNIPLYQYIAGGERTFAFTAVFSRDQAGEIGGSLAGTGPDEGKYNVDIKAAIKWLRSLQSPEYVSGQQFADPPPLLYLVFPNTALGQGDDDYALTFMSQCDVSYKKWFPNGTIRLAEVNLGFTETVQHPNGTQWYGRSTYNIAASTYTFKKGGNPDVG